MRTVSRTWSTDLNARSPVAATHTKNPYTLNVGSKWIASVIPPMTGTSARYVINVSRFRSITNARIAVKSGVVEPIAWLKETGIYWREMFPKSIVRQNAADSTTIFSSSVHDCTRFAGMKPAALKTADRKAVMHMW